MNIYQQMETDLSLENNGVWIELGEGAAIKVARFQNPKHKTLLDQLMKPYKAFTATGREIPETVREDIAVQSMAQTILLDWRGIQDKNGAELPYSVENAKRLLKELKEFRDVVATFANEASTFRKEEVAAIVGNSSPSSSGPSSAPAQQTSPQDGTKAA